MERLWRKRFTKLPLFWRLEGYSMSILAWLVVGLIAGFLASKVVNKRGEGVVMDIVLGIVGAIVGGFLFSMVGGAGVTGFNIYSMIVAVVWSIVVLLIYHAIVGRKHTTT